MKYGVLDKYFCKPFWLVGMLSIALPIFYVEKFKWSLWLCIVVFSIYALIILAPFFHRPKASEYQNIRHNKAQSILPSVSNLLGSEFTVYTKGNVVFGIKTYGLGGAFRTEFELTKTGNSISLLVNTNAPVPENWTQVARAEKAVSLALRSVGYVEKV